MKLQLFNQDAVLENPFYKQDIGAWGDRPKRAMFAANENGCFIWQGCFNSKGYPCRGSMLVHRQAWIAFYGSIPAGWQCHHVCKDKRCINISHLRCLSEKDHRLVEGHPLKLDVEKVREILRLIADGVPRRVIAARFNIARHYVTDIKNGKAWKQVVGDFKREGTTLSKERLKKAA